MNYSQGMQGAAGGAAIGTAVMPGWGTAIGAGIGLLGGLFGGGPDDASQYREQLQKLAAGYGSREAPQIGYVDQAGRSSLVGNRASLIAQLEARARGEAPSAAALQMRDAMDRASAAQASAAAGAGGRGVNAGAAYRNAADNVAAIQMQGARDTSTLRAQEQANAEGMLGSVINQGVASDNQMAMFNTDQNNQAAYRNMMSKLQMYGINDEATLRALSAAMGGAGPGLGTQLMAGGANALPGIMFARQQQQQQQGTLASAAGGFSPEGYFEAPGIGANDWRTYQAPYGWTSDHG